MIKFFKKLGWLIKNQEKIESLLVKPIKKESLNDGTYSLEGVPEYQREYLKEYLKDKN